MNCAIMELLPRGVYVMKCHLGSDVTLREWKGSLWTSDFRSVNHSDASNGEIKNVAHVKNSDFLKMFKVDQTVIKTKTISP